MDARINWFRVVLWSSVGYGLLFVAARSWLPPRAWTIGRTPAGYAIEQVKRHLSGEPPRCAGDESEPVSP